MSRRFVTLDVFTADPLTGNPLAVVLDAEGLDTAHMQAIAREFNLSETVFVLSPGRCAAARRHPDFHPQARIALCRSSHRRARRFCSRFSIRTGSPARRRSVSRKRSAIVSCAVEIAECDAAAARASGCRSFPKPGATGRESSDCAWAPRPRSDRDRFRPARAEPAFRGRALTISCRSRRSTPLARAKPNGEAFDAGLRRQRPPGRLCLYAPCRTRTASLPRPHVRARHGRRRRSGDGLGRRVLRRCADAMRAAGRRRA